MQPLKITQRGIDWLSQTQDFRILHHFDHVINLINPLGQVLAIHTAEVGLGPFSCLIEPPQFHAITSAASIQLDSHRKAFSINNDWFSTVGATLWDPRPNWRSFHQTLLIEIDHQLEEDIHAGMQAVHEAILSQDLMALQNATIYLAGRGIGLTPTGDDVLLGTIYALHVLDWNHDIVQLIEMAAFNRTTSLSAVFLQAAVAGEATEPWHRVMDQETGSLETLLSVGATSGKDAWVGFTMALKALVT